MIVVLNKRLQLIHSCFYVFRPNYPFTQKPISIFHHQQQQECNDCVAVYPKDISGLKTFLAHFLITLFCVVLFFVVEQKIFAEKPNSTKRFRFIELFPEQRIHSTVQLCVYSTIKFT